MTRHSPFGPSSRSRWVNCPGSVALSKDIPSKSSDHAIDGTRAHALLAECIFKRTSPLEYSGSTGKDEHGDFEISREMVEKVNLAYGYVLAQINEQYVEHLLIETEVCLPEDQDVFGTPDIIMVNSDYLEIVDYKHGALPVTAIGNPQLEQYAIMFLSSYERLKGLSPNYLDGLDEVRLTIIQPSASMFGANPISTWVIDKDYLMTEGKALLLEQIKAAASTDAPFVPGVIQCRWCKARAICPKLQSFTMEAIDVDGSKDLVDQVPSEPSVVTISRVLEAAPLIRSYLDAVETFAIEELKGGRTVEGFKLVKGRGTRKWALSDEEMADRFKKMLIPKSAIYTQKVVSPAKLKTLTWDKKGETQSLSKKQLELIEREYVVKSEGALQLAPDTDPREEAKLDVSALLEPIVSIPDFLKMRSN